MEYQKGGSLMNEKGYFDKANYTGNHLHLDNYKDQLTPFF